ncbi:MAG: HAD family phosphatase [bacterium]
MPKLIESIPFHAKIKNIIFDFGGVLCDLDIKRTERKFFEMGLKNFASDYSVTERDDLFRMLERGSLTPQQFHESLKQFFTRSVSDEEIDNAWNALLLGIPEERIRLLEEVRKEYRIFLLSNSNEIHYKQFLADFTSRFGYRDFTDLFEKVYFSFQIHLQKPAKEVFDFVLRDSNLSPQETLFIDDSFQHIDGARTAGIHACHLKINEGEVVTDLFRS